jgi:heme-degrading monooxygenase HmoA
MSVVWQIAGKMKEGQFEPLRDAFGKLARRFEGAEGFERAQLFVNHRQLQVQFLTYWSEFDASARFFKAMGSDFWQPLAKHTDESGTVVCSSVECDISARETAAAS